MGIGLRLPEWSECMSEADANSGAQVGSADTTEATYIEIPLSGRPLDRFAGFGVSLEPAGGSPYPDRRSGPQVFAVPLPQDS